MLRVRYVEGDRAKGACYGIFSKKDGKPRGIQQEQRRSYIYLTAKNRPLLDKAWSLPSPSLTVPK